MEGVKLMEEVRPKWGIALDRNCGNFLLGANINLGKWNEDRYGYLCIYLGFYTLVIGKDAAFDKGNSYEQEAN